MQVGATYAPRAWAARGVMAKRRKVMTCAALVLCAACRQTRPEPPDTVTIHVGDKPIARVDDRFLSLAIDSAQVVGGGFWNPEGSTSLIGDDPRPPFDFSRPRLRPLGRQLAPAYLRLGG